MPTDKGRRVPRISNGLLDFSNGLSAYNRTKIGII